MEKYAESSDGVSIHYEITGSGHISLVFVHGWLGNTGWWHNQQKYFENKYTIVTLDLAGHGKSGKTRQNWSSAQYADDIKAVAGELNSREIILVGHSMSGPYVMEASQGIPNLKAIILVDTFKDPDQVFTHAQADELIFTYYRKDFRSAVENILPQFLFAKGTQANIREQLKNDFLKYDGQTAVKLLETLYKMNADKIAGLVKVPVMAINSDYTPTNKPALRKYFPGFEYITIKDSGHYPMLEQPDQFNQALEGLIERLDNVSKAP